MRQRRRRARSGPAARAGLIGLAGLTGLVAGMVPATASQAGVPETAGAGSADGVIVRVESGAIRGAAGEDTRVFQGIPYAAPPVGELRWQDPEPPESWTGVLDATRPGPACAQLRGELPEGSDSEDCLYLNVTTPTGHATGPGSGSDDAAEAKPVIVWLHGGGFYMGAGHNYDARRMATQGDVVVVTLNYRLGVFGFFGHPGLEGSGTFGLKDQQAAMAWVQRNAEAFGGDPDNVTVAGQSAGGISNCAHLTSPSAAGLFDKAVMQSGSCELDWLDNFEYRGQPADAIYEPLPALEEQGATTAAELGCAGGDDAVIACLRDLTVDELTPVHQQFIQPAYGTATLPIDPVEALRWGLFHRVPVLSGTTSDEGTSATSMYDGLGTAMTEQTFDAVMAETFGTDEAQVRAEYPRSAADSAALTWAAITTDRKWACPQYDTSRHLARHVPVYQYEFADPEPPALSPLPPTMPMGAEHASELWSLFDLAGRAPDFTPAQGELSEQMIDYWAAFAATGDPGHASGPGWPAFEAGGQPPYVQSLAPGENGVGRVDLAAAHHCGFWSDLGR